MRQFAMRSLLLAITAANFLTATSVAGQTQCPSACQPTANGKSGPDTPTVVIAFGSGFSNQNIDAFVSALDIWNAAFLQTWTDLYFTTTGNTGPHIWIEVDPWLANGAYNATDNHGYGTIYVSPNELSRGHDFLAHLMAHELGHSLGFENNFGMVNSSTSCAGYTIMYGNLSTSGPIHQSIPSCDKTAVSNTYPTQIYDNPPPPGPGELYHTCVSPIILDLAGAGYRMTSLAEGVTFDIRNEGVARRVAWTRASAVNAFLAWDRNGNGTIDHGGELFGNRTRLKSGAIAQHGFEALSELDDNNDGVVDAQDTVWSALSLWIDRDHNGVSTADELQPIGASAVTALETPHRLVGRTDRWGNYLPYMGHFRLRHGASESRRAYYDVFLRVAE